MDTYHYFDDHIFNLDSLSTNIVVTKTVKSTFSCKNKINLVMEKLNT